MKKKRLITNVEDRLKWPFEYKIKYAQEKIKEWYEYHDGMVYVAFSGGKDSTVLLHMVRDIYPEVKGYYVNTGLEYPEINKFVDSTKNIQMLKPSKKFREVINDFGYPVVSKQVAEYVEQIRRNIDKLCSQVVRLRLIGLTKKNVFKQQFMLAEKWQHLIDAPFKISARCCKFMKKKPFIKITKDHDIYPYVGTMVTDSAIRKYSYTFLGCNSFNSEHPRSAPLSIFTSDDIWRYIKEKNIKYSTIYDKGVINTGCIFCMFGIFKDKNPNRFQVLKKIHPKIYKYCMNNLGLEEVLQYLKIDF